MIGIVNPKTGILLYYSNNWKEGLNEMKKALQRFGAKLFMKSDPAGITQINLKMLYKHNKKPDKTDK
jgi:hypothetical protein